MTQIKVKPEGRKDIWIPEKESLKEWIKSKNFESIHNFIPSSMMVIGADHDIDSVLKDIDKADRLALLTDSKANMGHSLSLITEEKLECYDVGEISEDDLEK